MEVVYVVETENGKVLQVIPFVSTPGKKAIDEAVCLAKLMCEANGILYQGKVSCDGSPKNYSIQIVNS